jgi:hypothetical protein
MIEDLESKTPADYSAGVSWLASFHACLI